MGEEVRVGGGEVWLSVRGEMWGGGRGGSVNANNTCKVFSKKKKM